MRQFYRRRMERKIAIANTGFFTVLWALCWFTPDPSPLLMVRLAMLTLGFSINTAVVIYCFIQPAAHFPPPSPPSPEKETEVIRFQQRKHG